MKISVLLIAAAVVIAACEREDMPDQDIGQGFDMEYIDLSGKEIGFNQSVTLDLNNDNRKDVVFSTLLVGDPIAKEDKMQYVVYSDFFSSLPVNEEENIPVQNKSDFIPVDNFGNYNWYNASFIVLAQKTIPESGNSYWTGQWKDAAHKYLPVQVKANDKRYNGWIELSFDANTQKTILHRAAISRKAEIGIKAGV